MCIDVYWCVLMYIDVYWCILMCNWCVLMYQYIDVYWCVLMCIDVYWCVLMCIDVYWCVYIHVYIFMCIFWCVYFDVYILMCIFWCVYIDVYILMCTYWCVYIDVYIAYQSFLLKPNWCKPFIHIEHDHLSKLKWPAFDPAVSSGVPSKSAVLWRERGFLRPPSSCRGPPKGWYHAFFWACWKLQGEKNSAVARFLMG